MKKPMDSERFDGLRVLRREYESNIGCSEVCRAKDGSDWIRLCVNDRLCQEDYLMSGASQPVRVEYKRLEILFPYEDGGTINEWFYDKNRSLGQRRELCLSVLAHCLEDKAAPVILTLSMKINNLRFMQNKAWLLYLPDWSNWRAGLKERDAVCAAAYMFREILMYGNVKALPVELKLLCLRVDECGYSDWGELQGDIAAIPDEFPKLDHLIKDMAGHLMQKMKRYIKPAAYAITVVLVVAALLSTISAIQKWRDEKRAEWPGMTPVGNQELERQ